MWIYRLGGAKGGRVEKSEMDKDCVFGLERGEKERGKRGGEWGIFNVSNPRRIFLGEMSKLSNG